MATVDATENREPVFSDYTMGVSQSLENVRKYVGYLLATDIWIPTKEEARGDKEAIAHRHRRIELIKSIRSSRGAILTRKSPWPINFHSPSLWNKLIAWMCNADNVVFQSLVGNVLAYANKRVDEPSPTAGTPPTPTMSNMAKFYGALEPDSEGFDEPDDEISTNTENGLGLYNTYEEMVPKSPFWEIAKQANLPLADPNYQTPREVRAMAVADHTLMLAIFLFEVIPHMPGLISFKKASELGTPEGAAKILDTSVLLSEPVIQSGHFISYLAAAINILRPLNMTNKADSTKGQSAEDSISGNPAAPEAQFRPPTKGAYTVSDLSSSDLKKRRDFRMGTTPEGLNFKKDLGDVAYLMLHLFRSMDHQYNQFTMALNITYPGGIAYSELAKLYSNANVILATSAAYKFSTLPIVNTVVPEELLRHPPAPDSDVATKFLPDETKMRDAAINFLRDAGKIINWTTLLEMYQQNMIIKAGNNNGSTAVSNVLTKMGGQFSWSTFSDALQFADESL